MATWKAVVVALAVALTGCGQGNDDSGGAGAEVSTLGRPGPALKPAPAGAGKPTAVREGDPLAEMDAYIAAQRLPEDVVGWRTRLPAPIQVGFPKDRHVYWILETNRGRMVLRLWHRVAPLHVSNLIYLTRLGFYDGLTFHRVRQGFMAQGGSPTGTSSGMLSYGLPLEVRPDVKHDRRGLLSTARATAPNTAGSQFFLTFRPAPELDMNAGGDPRNLGYTVFGEILEGLETLALLEAVGAPPSVQSEAPRQPLLIKRATVELR